MKNKNNSPTIEQSLKMIEERLKSEEKSKKINKNINEQRENKTRKDSKNFVQVGY